MFNFWGLFFIALNGKKVINICTEVDLKLIVYKVQVSFTFSKILIHVGVRVEIGWANF